MTSKQNHWWKTGVIYQIYPKSFQDTTGSGTGDIQGIISRLDYLQELGVDAIWITPMYISPQVDNGYDIADYYEINPDYGTMADFEQLVSQAHQRNIRIIMDMVFNHTSTEHQWFKQAQDPKSPYHDFYIWRGDKEEQLPNNWLSKFGGNAWQWSEQAQKHYLHLFATKQADLNWENPQVRAELFKIVNFWAEKGIDGLRLDVINLISKNQDFPNDYEGDGRRFYTDGPRVHQYLQELNQKALSPNNLMTVGEMSSTKLEHCLRYAANTGNELSMTFNFHHLKVDYPKGEKWIYAKPDYVELKKIMNYWQQGMHGKAWNALFWSNHDQPRVVSRFGHEGEYHLPATKMLAMLLFGFEGTPYIYQGEEFGATNPNFSSIEQYRDVESLNMYQILLDRGLDKEQVLKILAQKSRDNSRTPMQWDDSANAGFTTGTPWIEVASNYPQINAKAALADPNSAFYTFKQLIRLRKEFAIFTTGDYQDLLPDSQEVWAYQRSTITEKLVVVANLTEQSQTIDLPALTNYGSVIVNNYEQVNLVGNQLTLEPFQALYFYTQM